MSTIKLLPEHLINQIAAGEVVERPASVVKELIENALDADARHITVEVRGGGDAFIRITDDGYGMDRSDALLAFERHATSKIENSGDLFRIHTLGFRGEAIASIAAVSYFTLQTKKRGEIEGTFLMAEGGIINKVKTIGAAEGTQIEVKQLFFNTPARKKYLKNPTTEYGHIFDTVMGASLAFPQVAFRLVHDQRMVFDLPQEKDFLQRIRSLFGNNITEHLIPVDVDADAHSEVCLKGFIGKPLLFRSNRSAQYIFVNHREVKSHVLSYAVKSSYHSLLPKEKYPVFFLNLELDPHLVDVNVHPRKLEVRFSDEKQMFELTSQTCKNSLSKHVLAPQINDRDPVNYYQERQYTPFVLKDQASESYNSASLPSQSGSNAEKVSASSGSSLNHRSSPELIQAALAFTQNLAQLDPTSAVGLQSKVESECDMPSHWEATISHRSVLREREKISEIIPLTQIKKSYLLCEDEDSLVIIDQHAAHERIRYHELLEQFDHKEPVIAQLLTPLQLELSPKQIVSYEQNHQILETMGFEIEPFGGNTFLIRAIPGVLKEENLLQTLHGLLDDSDYHFSQNELEKRKECSTLYLACRTAVKFGDVLTYAEQKEILKKLSALALPYTCPHGRPTMITLSFDELRKRFGRYYG